MDDEVRTLERAAAASPGDAGTLARLSAARLRASGARPEYDPWPGLHVMAYETPTRLANTAGRVVLGRWGRTVAWRAVTAGHTLPQVCRIESWRSWARAHGRTLAVIDAGDWSAGRPETERRWQPTAGDVVVERRAVTRRTVVQFVRGGVDKSGVFSVAAAEWDSERGSFRPFPYGQNFSAQSLGKPSPDPGDVWWASPCHVLHYLAAADGYGLVLRDKKSVDATFGSDGVRIRRWLMTAEEQR